MAASIPSSIKPVAQTKVILSGALQGLWYMLAVLSSGTVIWLSHSTFIWCFGHSGGCGTPCVTSAFEMLLSPLILILPFIKLLTAKRLSGFGLVARCALTSAIGVWGIGIVTLWRSGYVMF